MCKAFYLAGSLHKEAKSSENEVIFWAQLKAGTIYPEYMSVIPIIKSMLCMIFVLQSQAIAMITFNLFNCLRKRIVLIFILK